MEIRIRIKSTVFKTGSVNNFFFNEPLVILDDPKHSLAEERFAAFGKTDGGRRLIIIYTMRGSSIRVISARDMNRKERDFYEDAGK